MGDQKRHNAGDPDSVKDAERREKQTRRQEIDDFLWLMNHKQFRRFMWGLLRRSGLLRINFSPNAMTLSFNEGNRNLGAQYYAEIEALCPEKYLLMVKENRERADPAHDPKE